MTRFLIATPLVLVLTACGMDFGLTETVNELTIMAINGEEEDWGQGIGDFMGEATEQDGERPEMFRQCDAEGTFARLMQEREVRAEGEEDCERGEGPPEGERPDGEGPDQSMGGGPEGEGPRSELGGRHAGMMQVLTMVYDADGDGELSDAERDTLLADFTERCEAIHARILEEFDADGDGELSQEEMEEARATVDALREEHRADMEERGPPERGVNPAVAEFDADGDGELSDEELATMQAAIQERIRSGEPLGECHV